MTTEITCFNPCDSMDRMKAVERMGEFIARSQMVGCETKEQGVIVAMTCAMEGIHPIEFGRRYHIIKGRPSMRADRMAAEFRARGGKYEIKTLSRECCECEFTFEKQKLLVKITFEDAKLAGWALDSKGGIIPQWKKTPDDMLFARVMSKGVRRLCPEVVAGIYTPEETQDFVEVEVSTPEPAKPPMMKAKAPVLDPEPVQEVETIEAKEIPAESEDVDYSVCPVPGKAFGTPWHDWSENAMDALSSSRDVPRISEAMTERHWEEMQIVRESRP